MKVLVNPTKKKLTGLVIIPFKETDDSIKLPAEVEARDISTKVFSGKKDSTFLFESAEKKTIFLLLGLGKDPEYKTIKTAFRRITAKQESLIDSEAHIFFNEEMDSAFVEAAVSGFVLGTYRLAHFKTDDKKDFSDLKLYIHSKLNQVSKDVEKAQKIAIAQLETFKLVDLPPNTATPEYLADWAKNSGKQYGFSVKVLDRKKAQKEKLEAFLAVSQGSIREPQFIIMTYKPKKANKHIGLVGKGVTFDTGGLNIKTQGMVHMKCDMGGAAAVLGAMQLIADLKLAVQVTAIVPCVENAVDSHSFLPSDVIGSYSGKTIEIIDTDAEGRLILADGLSYLVKNFKPDTIIDFATLTGSTVGTFGYECAALFTNDQELSKNLQNEGQKIGERVWQLPLWECYKSEMDSEIADIKNFHGKPFAGAITAAKFLEFFTEKHPSWAHVDIAGTAFGDSEFAKTKHGTAFGVHLLVKLLENH
ncbi:leucyl aminopeptidase family protein [Mongoliibacter ruber]|uniref:Leucyl aminopeptidase n=1 Tax=Mongoliibacter ruber TaxID=1750599 RepID=A0A2T0WMW9_9BACT|nr:leucyl aminopeptidase family protein [Mongoliibacter ruber]PRY88040.1 leucyl aminopeptidase [Mongoliibacter ruber]